MPTRRAYLAGLAAQRIAGCGKHFPGLGGAASDTHFETPEIHRTWQQLWEEDLEPYRALRAEMPMVMMNHAAYPETPAKNVPASASAFWITDVLRKRIGYRGIILSDDLEMGGILKFMPIEEAAIAAIRAGIGSAGDLPQPRTDPALLRGADCGGRALRGLPKAPAARWRAKQRASGRSSTAAK